MESLDEKQKHDVCFNFKTPSFGSDSPCTHLIAVLKKAP